MARGMAAGTLPPFCGIRIKPFSDELARRSLRTLDIFLTTMAREGRGQVPANFVVTLPKITCAEQVETLGRALEQLEQRLRLPAGTLTMEFMVETTQSIIGADGALNLPRLLDAARGRCVAAHFGTYDYTASCNITAHHQRMRHPACDFAKHMMQVAYSGRGIFLSDGATTTMPVPVHRAEKGASLTDEQERDNRRSVHDAWRLHVADIQHSLETGFYQGWDLHPGAAADPLRRGLRLLRRRRWRRRRSGSRLLSRAAQATLVGDVFDDAATGQGLLNFFLRGINWGGAFGEEEALATGLTIEELRSRSFYQILVNRRTLAGSSPG